MKGVHRFGPTRSAGPPLHDAVNRFGSKGAYLDEMCRMHLPVPPGLIIPTYACNDYWVVAKKNVFMDKLITSMGPDILWLNHQMKEVYTKERPFIISVRSGARVSMPGMMDSVLNVGLHFDNIDKAETVLGAYVAWDSLRRLIQMYATVVLGAPPTLFETIIMARKEKEGVKVDSEISLAGLKFIVEKMLDHYEHAGYVFPHNRKEQLKACIEAVFKSWNNERAIHYRNMMGYSHDWGTAVILQAMVFGNGPHSATGVLFTRNPFTGKKLLTGEYLVNAQGEDLVSGIRTPLIFSQMYHDWPDMYSKISSLAIDLEEAKKDMQDIEWTVDDGVLWVLQTRRGKRTSQAAFRIAYEMMRDDVLTLDEAISQVTFSQWRNLTEIRLKKEIAPDCIGIPGGGGLVQGIAVFGAEAAVAKAKLKNVIMVAKETTPEDIKGIEAAKGILTTTGGATCHAAVVARGLDTACVVGCSDLQVTSVGLQTPQGLVTEGTPISLDGNTGKVYIGSVELVKDSIPEYAIKLVVGYVNEKGIRLRAREFLKGLIEVEIPYVDFSTWQDLVSLIAKYMKAGTKIFIDLTTPEKLFGTVDHHFLEAMGTPTLTSITPEMIVKACKKQKLPVTFVGIEDSGTVAHKLSDMLKGVCTPSTELINSLGGQEVADVIFSALEEKGLLPKPKGKVKGKSLASLLS